MKIKKILIEYKIQEKIFKKHRIIREEIEHVFFGKPYFFRTRKNRYIAIGNAEKLITVIFEIKNNEATIITAYQSSRWQKNLYNKKWKK